VPSACSKEVGRACSLRTYSGQGASEFVDRVVAASDEVEGLLRGVEGFVSYTLFRTEDGGVTRSVRRRQASMRASEWHGTGLLQCV
jgi:hypothetical protein